MDAIALLKSDHKTVEGLFKRFEKAGDRAHKRKRDLVDTIVEELSVHAAIEEQVLYPAARQAIPEEDETVLEALEEHHVVKLVLKELETMPATAERFDAKVTVLIENVRHHVKEEEGELFPALRKALGRKRLQELGEAMERAKAVAPTRPHPAAPDEPPGVLVAGTAAAVVDRAVKAGRRAVEKVARR